MATKEAQDGRTWKPIIFVMSKQKLEYKINAMANANNSKEGDHNQNNKNKRKRVDHGEQDTNMTAGKGLFGTLKRLRDQDVFLKEKKPGIMSCEWGGRRMDKKMCRVNGIEEEDMTIMMNEGGDLRKLSLVKKDEYGRNLTPKEAFRRFCHEFHGIQPSKKRRAKWEKQNRKLMELESKNSMPDSYYNMHKEILRLQQPHVPISGYIK